MAFMFEDLVVYQKAMELVSWIYKNSGRITDKEIKDQLMRAALSIPLNIAEGNGRNTLKEKIQFYKTARGSLFECVPILQLIAELNFINGAEHQKLYVVSEEIGKMLNGLINSLNKYRE